MKLFERDLCERLFQMGCVGESYACYLNFSLPEGCQVQIFTLYDFIAPTDQARKNCKKIFSEEWMLYRDQIVNSKSEHEAEQVIKNAKVLGWEKRSMLQSWRADKN